VIDLAQKAFWSRHMSAVTIRLDQLSLTAGSSHFPTTLCLDTRDVSVYPPSHPPQPCPPIKPTGSRGLKRDPDIVPSSLALVPPHPSRRLLADGNAGWVC